MRYNALLEISAILFLAVIAVHFFTRQRFPSRANRFFGVLLLVSLVDIAADIASVFVIEHSARIPMFWNWSVNMLLYLCQITLPPLLTVYTLCLTGKYLRRYSLGIGLLLVPYAAVLLLLALNPWTGMFFYFDQTVRYAHGPWFLLLYGETLFYLAAAAGVTLSGRRSLRLAERNTLYSFIGMIAVSVLMQYLFPSYLITGVALALSVTMMYLTLQNPNDLLDSVTGVFNRDSSLIYLTSALAAKHHFQLIRLGVSGVDRIGNALGLRCSDAVIRQAAQFLRHVCRNGALFRIRDDSFLIIHRSERATARVLQAVEERFARPWCVNDLSLKLGLSIIYLSDGLKCSSLEELLGLFDSVSLPVDGTSAIRFAEISDVMLDRARRSARVETLLRGALERHMMDIVIQPIYSFRESRIIGGEALARLRDDSGAVILPGEFIPIAERSGLISKVGDQVLEKTCAFLDRSGLKDDPDFESVSVNLSVTECLDEQLVSKINSAAAGHGVLSEKLCFEITETTATLSAALPEKMNRLLDLGYHFSLDDFGTGYANYDSFMRLPFSFVKFDRQMLQLCGQAKKSETLFFRTLDMTMALGFHVVVEGVETKDQARLLETHGVEYAQGYFFSRPLEPEDFLALYLRQRRGSL